MSIDRCPHCGHTRTITFEQQPDATAPIGRLILTVPMPQSTGPAISTEAYIPLYPAVPQGAAPVTIGNRLI